MIALLALAVSNATYQGILACWLESNKLRVLESGRMRTFQTDGSYSDLTTIRPGKSVLLYDPYKFKFASFDIKDFRLTPIKPPQPPRVATPNITANFVACSSRSGEAVWLWYPELRELYKFDLKTRVIRLQVSGPAFESALGRKLRRDIRCEYSGIALSPDGTRLALAIPGTESATASEADTRRPLTVVYDLQKGSVTSLGKGTPIGWVDNSSIVTFHPRGLTPESFEYSLKPRRSRSLGRVVAIATSVKKIFVLKININSNIPYNEIYELNSAQYKERVWKVPDGFGSYWFGSRIPVILTLAEHD